mmetsp:Transcript_4561/g.6796  ORF Transcript_4561/g.6796 Transcript_4561/m.6796 type:complete len:199 (+) Transcript_4561:1976-2572(+)
MVDGGNGSASEGLGERVELHHGHDIDGYVELGRPDGHHRVCHRVEYAEQRRTGGHARQKENATEHRGELFVLVTNDRRAVKVEQDGERDYVDCRKRYVVLYSRALVRNETAQQKTLTYQNRPENAAKLDSAWTTALRHIALVYEQRLGNVYCPSCENHSTEHAQDDLARLISYLAPLKRQLCPFAVAIPHKNLETVND